MVFDIDEDRARIESPEFPNMDKVRNLVRLLGKDDVIGNLIKACNQVGEAFLFGGMVRDELFGSHGRFGDLDIFVSGPIDYDFASSLASSSRRTNFGGMRLIVGKFDVDIWELPKSHAFVMERGRVVSIESLLGTVCFSTDAVAVSLLDSRVISTPVFRRTLKSRIFDFVRPPSHVEILQAVRVARLIIKNDVVPSEQVAEFFLDSCDRFGVEYLLLAESKWKGRRVLDDFSIGKAKSVCRRVQVLGAEEVVSVGYLQQQGLWS